MKKIALLATLVLTIYLVAGCSSVELTPEGQKARVLTNSEVQRCDKTGTATATVQTDIAGVPRRQTVITRELKELARNTAATMGGDTVVPISKVKNGSQRFRVYKCVP